jgi:hypothetical protein
MHLLLNAISTKWTANALDVLLQEWWKYLFLIIPLFFKRVRRYGINIYRYLYNKLPYVKVQRQDRETFQQMATNVSEMKETFSGKLDAVIRKGSITQSLVLSMLDDNYDGKIITDPLGKWTKVNRTFLIWMAATDKDILEDGWVSYLSDILQKSTCERYMDAVTHKRGASFATKFQRNGIINYDCQFVMKPIRDADTFFGFEITIKKI